MKKPKMPLSVKEIDSRIFEIKDEIDDENNKLTSIREELKQKTIEADKNIKSHEILIQEYKLLLKHYQAEKDEIANPSSRRNKIESKN